MDWNLQIQIRTFQTRSNKTRILEELCINIELVFSRTLSYIFNILITRVFDDSNTVAVALPLSPVEYLCNYFWFITIFFVNSRSFCSVVVYILSPLHNLLVSVTVTFYFVKPRPITGVVMQLWHRHSYNSSQLYNCCNYSSPVFFLQINSYCIRIAILKATFRWKPLILSAYITIPAIPHRPFLGREPVTSIALQASALLLY